MRGTAAERMTGELVKLYNQQRTLNDAGLVAAADALRSRHRSSNTGVHPAAQASICLEGVALAGVAVQRVFGFEPHGVQLWGAMLVSIGRIAEMQTGEGKTIVAGMAAFVSSLSGQGVHVATTNSYLARRDYHELLPVFKLLNVSSGLLPEDANLAESQRAYSREITYGTGYQFGFDYLRDQLAIRDCSVDRLGDRTRSLLCGVAPEMPPVRQRGQVFAILDEIDSVLIDEAVTPLVLSGPADKSESPFAYHIARQAVEAMTEGRDYLIEATGRVLFQRQVIEASFQKLQTHRHVKLARGWAIYLNNAFQALRNLERDVDYVIRDEDVCIVDQNTGRIFADRSWRDGLHQAVQAKEGVPIKPSESSLARITRQRYIQRYQRLGGLTGTAVGSEVEFRDFYQLEVTRVPPAQPCVRQELPTRYFNSQENKRRALVTEVQLRHRHGQPILIGTRTIQESLNISRELSVHGLKHSLLNGLQDQEEAEIVAGAGVSGRITIATNMAGRGTDIRLSGDAACQQGLHVIGTDRHESSRVDRQLMGRAARQGQPGSSQFFVSAEDQFLTEQAPRLSEQIEAAANQSGEAVHRRFDRAVADAQRRCEAAQLDQRRRLVMQDRWTNQIRESFLGVK